MGLSHAQRNLIVQDFVVILKEKYGEDWFSYLTCNLTPSPIKPIAEYHGVKLYQVKQIRRQLKVLGHYIELVKLLVEPLPNYQATLDESLWF